MTFSLPLSKTVARRCSRLLGLPSRPTAVAAPRGLRPRTRATSTKTRLPSTARADTPNATIQLYRASIYSVSRMSLNAVLYRISYCRNGLLLRNVSSVNKDYFVKYTHRSLVMHIVIFKESKMYQSIRVDAGMKASVENMQTCQIQCFGVVGRLQICFCDLFFSGKRNSHRRSKPEVFLMPCGSDHRKNRKCQNLPLDHGSIGGIADASEE